MKNIFIQKQDTIVYFRDRFPKVRYNKMTTIIFTKLIVLLSLNPLAIL